MEGLGKTTNTLTEISVL